MPARSRRPADAEHRVPEDRVPEEPQPDRLCQQRAICYRVARGAFARHAAESVGLSAEEFRAMLAEDPRFARALRAAEAYIACFMRAIVHYGKLGRLPRRRPRRVRCRCLTRAVPEE